MRHQAIEAAPAMIVEGEAVIVGGDDVVAFEALGRLDPDRAEAAIREALEKRVGEDVTGTTGEEDAVGQGPALLGVLLDAGAEAVHRRILTHSFARRAPWLPLVFRSWDADIMDQLRIAMAAGSLVLVGS